MGIITEHTTKLKLLAAVFLPLVFFTLLSCSDDSFDSALALENLPLQTLLVEQVEMPVPGNSGLITFAGITDSTVDLVWTGASAEGTPPAEILYKVVYSALNNINTPEDAELNGLVAMDWTAGVTSGSVTGLTAGATYYFNVIAKDGDGIMAAYSTVSATTSSDVVYLYSAGQHSGDFAYSASSMMSLMVAVSPRDDVDAFCVNAKNTLYPSLSCSNVRAFISISNTDSISSMPLNFSVPNVWELRSVTNMIIADNWSDLMDGTINDELQNLGVADSFWWSGSNPDGTAAADNCGSWTIGTNAAQGVMGAHNRTTDQWLNWSSTNCNTSRHVLCICW